VALRSADQLLAHAVGETLEALNLEPEDVAAARLARKYAEALDEVEDPAKYVGIIGPSLLKVLESLGATPRARAEIGRRLDDGGTSQLAKLRAARR
jgi:hypothetical protein